MKAILIIGLTGVMLFSCKKEKSYLKFTEKQLVFVNYTEGQNLKFIDTASVVHTLVQYKYLRSFHEHIGIYGKTGAFTEEYEAYYSAQNNGDIDLSVILNSKSLPPLEISFASYATFATPDSITYTFPSLTINGKTYNEVYTLKMYKDGRYNTNPNDTATLFHNKEFGVIQLLFPNGKKIVRVD